MNPNSNVLRWLGLAALCLLLAANYFTNFAGLVEESTFRNWQQNGQARVLGGIHADRVGIDKDGTHMGKLWPVARGGTDWTGVDSSDETYRIFANPDPSEPILFEHYRQQYGLHAAIYSALSRHLGLQTLEALQAVTAILTAFMVTMLFAVLLRVYNPWLAGLFLLTFACAPLFVAMARNLYWSPFLLLLPTVASAWMYLARSRNRRLAFLGLVWIAMLLKCLSNYEYITSVTLLACAVFLVAPMFDDPVSGRPDFRGAAVVFAACVLAFAFAFVIHASSRGDGLLDGIRTMLVEDVLRRTYGDASSFSGETAESLLASPWDVLKIYLFDYPGKRTMLVPGKAFLAMIGLCVVGLGTRLVVGERTARRDAWAFLVFFSVPVSWFVLAKGHSYTQTHINFVLWFIGFMPALLFVTGNTTFQLIRLMRSRWRAGFRGTA